MASLSSTPSRPLPNILITGTPGTGKTTLSQSLAEELSFTHLEVSAFVKQHSLHEGVDAEFDSLILDEDKLVDALEPLVAGGGQVVDFHSPGVFPERYFDLVLVLRSSTEALYDRLTERGYKENKRDENVTAEIMQVVLEEARESYAEEIVHEVRSDTVEEMDANVERVKAWVGQWKADNKQRELRAPMFPVQQQQTMQQQQLPTVQAIIPGAQPTSVAGFLEAAGCLDKRDAFDAEGVDMVAMMALTNDDLKELGLNMGQRKKLLHVIESGK